MSRKSSDLVTTPRKRKPRSSKKLATRPGPTDYEDLVKLAMRLVKNAKIPKGYRAVVIVTDSEEYAPGTWLKVGVSSNCTSSQHAQAMMQIALHGREKKIFEDVIDMPTDQPAKLGSGE